MNHERAFLQAIREAPHDDAPRLIYADWLEEQGGAARTARADFIRLQCRLAELPDDDPARDALEDEAADLLAEHEQEWTHLLHGLAVEWSFVRGFVERISIRGSSFLSHAERLLDFTPLRALHLLIHSKDVPHLAACPQLQTVETLDFSRSSLNDRSLQQLLTSPYLTRLTALEMPGNDITTAGLQTLVSWPAFARLRRLDLSRNIGVGDKAIRLLARATQAENLEELSLAATNITLDGLHDLFQSPNLPRLTSLNIARTRSWYAQLTSPLRIWKESRLLAQLHSLDVSGNVHPTSLRVLLETLTSAHLQALYLRGIRAESTDVKLLASSPHLASLRHLDVSSNNLRDTGTMALVESAYLTRLRVLDLAGNGIGGRGLQAVAESAHFDRLRTIHLGGNFIGTDSVRVLSESPHLRNLTRLDLSDAFLEEESAHALASAANLARLTTLRLAKNLLGDGGAKALARSPHLRRLVHLDLNDNRIGKAGAEALAAAPSWRRMRDLDLRGNVFTDTQETLLRERFGDAVRL
jgi:uncharacterized protein (TIGR02996 family)